MTFLKLRVYIIKPKKNMIEERSYGKSELAMLYFPHSQKKIAINRLTRWIKNIPPLYEQLQHFNVSKDANFYSRPQVKLIVDYLCEPYFSTTKTEFFEKRQRECPLGHTMAQLASSPRKIVVPLHCHSERMT